MKVLDGLSTSAVGERAGRGRRVGLASHLASVSITEPVVVAGNDGGVVAAVDGDRHQLWVPSTVVTVNAVGQLVADIERLHRAGWCCRACRSTRQPVVMVKVP